MRLFGVFASILFVSARSWNYTIDDTLGDQWTGRVPQYLGSSGHPWVAGTSAQGCLNCGSKIYIFCILANNIGLTNQDTRLTFYLDGAATSAGNYLHIADMAVDNFLYNQLVFESELLDDRDHTLLISNYASAGSGSLILFDYAIYSEEPRFAESRRAGLGDKLQDSHVRNKFNSSFLLGQYGQCHHPHFTADTHVDGPAVLAWLLAQRKKCRAASAAAKSNSRPRENGGFGDAVEAYLHDAHIVPFPVNLSTYGSSGGTEDVSQRSAKFPYTSSRSDASKASSRSTGARRHEEYLLEELDNVRHELEALRTATIVHEFWLFQFSANDYYAMDLLDAVGNPSVSDLPSLAGGIFKVLGVVGIFINLGNHDEGPVISERDAPSLAHSQRSSSQATLTPTVYSTGDLQQACWISGVYTVLNPTSLHTMRDEVKIAVASAIRSIERTELRLRTWLEVTTVLMHSPLLSPSPEEAVDRTDMLRITQRDWDQDGPLGNHLVVEGDGGTAASVAALARSAVQGLTLHRGGRKYKLFLDLSFLCFPNSEHPCFKARTPSFNSFGTSSSMPGPIPRVLKVALPDSVTEYNVRIIKPRSNVIASMREEPRKKAAAIVEQYFARSGATPV
ncbi:hypothetical protein AURDEDRAFT_130451 [Auricularia subglabra TFB-10046 SS5]|nr:hypothetical protein AURDEDRAFT_130451 [Auricularia subglabra TFB-10046 SS5]